MIEYDMVSNNCNTVQILQVILYLSLEMKLRTVLEIQDEKLQKK